MKKLKNFISIFTAIAIIAVGVLGCSSDSDGGGKSDFSSNQQADGTFETKINEGQGLVGYDATLSSATGNIKDWEGKGFLDNPKYVIYAVNSPEAQIAKISIRYSHWGWKAQVKAAYVSVNGIDYLEPNQILYGNWTNKNLEMSNEIEIPLVAGENTIRLDPVEKGTELIQKTSNMTYGLVYPEGYEGTLGNVAGLNKADGMIPNLDYIKIVTPKQLTLGNSANTYYKVSVASENENAGTVSSSIETKSALKDTSITLTATAKAGYKFDCFYGTLGENYVASNDTAYTFKLTGEANIKARFIPTIYNVTIPAGYATVADDSGTKYTITGGFGGEEITISSLDELTTNKAKLSDNEPRIIKIATRISTADNVSLSFDLGSNKTLIGEAGKDYGFKNIEIKITGSNVIVRNLHFGDVIGDDYWGGKGNDAMAIKGGQHVWVDHCEFSSHLIPYNTNGTILPYDSKYPVDMEGESGSAEDKWKKDFYDGLLDVSETSRFVTISNSYFHDHWKACLCGGSNDKAESQPQGKHVRLTFCNNYFENIHARQPLFRFGKAHIYSSYIKGISSSESTGIEVRAKSEVYVDNVCFENVRSDRTVGCWNSSSGLGEGEWKVLNCIGPSNNSTKISTPPYEWIKTSAADSRTNLPTTAGIEK